jgi:hypothetical protein
VQPRHLLVVRMTAGLRQDKLPVSHGALVQRCPYLDGTGHALVFPRVDDTVCACTDGTRQLHIIHAARQQPHGESKCRS